LDVRISDHPSSARVPRRRAGSAAGRVLLITVAVLAVLAAGLMVLADQARWLRLGVAAALWAALAGAFAAARYRRELLGHTDAADDLQRVYELELEREVSARREYELEMETSTRRQVEQEVRNEVRGELDGLRAELRTLRLNLEVLLGGKVPPNVERPDTGPRPAPVPRAQAGNPTEVLPPYRPENDGPGGRRRRPDTGSPPLSDITAARRHAADGKPASNGTGRRAIPEIQGRAIDDLEGTPETSGPRRRHRREA
jgi:hypothetical protein